MSFESFVRACDASPAVRMTQVMCCSGTELLASCVKYPYQEDSLKLFYSMTKTIAALAIGVASDLGLLSIDDPIVRFFPEDLPRQPHPHLGEITIRHLLTMSCGIDRDTYPELFPQENWPRAFLAQDFPRKPGTHYLYCTHGTHMLSAIITHVSGLLLEDFVNRYLFHPMGITEAVWETSPEGLTAGGMGLSLRPASLVKIAQLFLNGGVYQGRRLVSADYLALATTRQITKGEDEGPYSGDGYGFQLHIGKDGCYRMHGSFGQFCLICPEKNLAVIMFSQNSDGEAALELIHRHLLEAPEVSGRIMEAPPAPAPVTQPIPCGRYAFPRNEFGLQSLTISPIMGSYRLELQTGDAVQSICFSPWDDTTGRMSFVKDLQDHWQTYVCRTTFDEALRLTVWLIETPYVATYTLDFSGGRVCFGFDVNVSFTLRPYTLEGIRFE